MSTVTLSKPEANAPWIMNESNAEEILERIYREGASDLIVDLPDRDDAALRMLHRLSTLPIDPMPRVYLVLNRPLPFDLPDFVLYCFYRPITEEALAERIASFQSVPTQHGASNRLVDRYCSEVLLRLGISPHLKGFRMLRLALLYLLAKPEYEDVQMMSELYPAIAAQTGRTVSMVEHSMRHAIETGWLRADLNEIESFFGYTTRGDKPTPSNSAFLFTLAERIRHKLFDAENTASIGREMQRLDRLNQA